MGAGMKEIKILFPESGWTLKARRVVNRIELGLYWGSKETPTHVAAIGFDDLVALLDWGGKE